MIEIENFPFLFHITTFLKITISSGCIVSLFSSSNEAAQIKVLSYKSLRILDTLQDLAIKKAIY